MGGNFMPEYVEYLIISIAALSLIAIGLAAFLIIKVQYITQYFNNRKFKLSMKLEVDPESHKDKFVFHIFNNNLNDARVSDLGIGYDQESITFYKDKMERESLEESDWLVIPTRDSISIEIDVKKTYELILERNKGTYRLKKVRIYVIDAAGFETRVKARDFVKTIKKMLKADRKLIAQGKCRIRKEKFRAFFDFKAKKEEKAQAEKEKQALVKSEVATETKETPPVTTNKKVEATLKVDQEVNAKEETSIEPLTEVETLVEEEKSDAEAEVEQEEKKEIE